MEGLEILNISLLHTPGIRYSFYPALPFELDRIAFDVLWSNPFISRIDGGNIMLE